jgi:hypothetical protein
MRLLDEVAITQGEGGVHMASDLSHRRRGQINVPARRAGCERLQLLGEAKFKRCAGCGSVANCARACQVKHWKGHKAACRKDAAVFPPSCSRDDRVGHEIGTMQKTELNCLQAAQ